MLIYRGIERLSLRLVLKSTPWLAPRAARLELPVPLPDDPECRRPNKAPTLTHNTKDYTKSSAREEGGADENGTRAPVGARGSDTRVPRTDGRNDPAIASRSTPSGGGYSMSVSLLALSDNVTKNEERTKRLLEYRSSIRRRHLEQN